MTAVSDAVSDAASGADFDDAAAAQLDHAGRGDLETDVLIIGSGHASGAAALALATLGVEHLVITKYRWTANTPARTSPTIAPWRSSGTSASRTTSTPRPARAS